VERSPPRISCTVGFTSPRYSNSTVFPSEALSKEGGREEGRTRRRGGGKEGRRGGGGEEGRRGRGRGEEGGGEGEGGIQLRTVCSVMGSMVTSNQYYYPICNMK